MGIGVTRSFAAFLAELQELGGHAGADDVQAFVAAAGVAAAGAVEAGLGVSCSRP